MLDTSNPNNYSYETKHLEIHILGGVKTNKLESLGVTISIQKPNAHNILRHNIDLYNDNQMEKLLRKVAERIEIGTSINSQKDTTETDQRTGDLPFFTALCRRCK